MNAAVRAASRRGAGAPPAEARLWIKETGMAKRRVVITGAAGYVGQRMFKELAERWDLVPIDVIPATRSGEKVPGLIVADLTRPDRNEYRQHFRGADAV